MQKLAAGGAGLDGGRDGKQARESHYKIKRAAEDTQGATDGIVTDAANDSASNPQRLIQLEGKRQGGWSASCDAIPHGRPF